MKNKSLANVIMNVWMAFVIGTIPIGATALILGYPIIGCILGMCMSVIGILLVLPAVTFWSKTAWFIKLIAAFNKKMIPVELINYNGERVFTMAKKFNDGTMHASTYWMDNIGSCILLPNGKVDPNSESSYHFFWIPLRLHERVAFLLTYDLPDFDYLDSLSGNERTKILFELRNT